MLFVLLLLLVVEDKTQFQILFHLQNKIVPFKNKTKLNQKTKKKNVWTLHKINEIRNCYSAAAQLRLAQLLLWPQQPHVSMAH